MTNTPMVSVATCFWNTGSFIEEAIESVLAQTHGNWELLLVDDGSDDNSSEIAQRYASRYPRDVRFFEHPGHANRGSSVSRNLALRHARGEYLAILDSDDVWLPNALENRLELIRRHPDVGMVYGPALRWHDWAGDCDGQLGDSVEELYLAPGTVFTPPAFCAYLLDYDAAIPSPCAILVRRSVLEAVGGFEDSFSTLFDDQALYIKISLKTAILVSALCDSKYRQHRDSTCAVADRAGVTGAARLIYFDWVRHYLLEQGVKDDSIWGALNAICSRFQRPWTYRLSQTVKRLAGRFRTYDRLQGGASSGKQ
jgi:glycosyltransferase involved in cell wall biosynthesis